MSIGRTSCSPLADWLLGWEKRVFFSLRKVCVTCPWIGCRRRFRWCAGAHGGEVGGRFLFVALAHASRVGAVVAPGGVRLLGFPRVAEANRKAVDEGERVSGQDILSALELCPPHQKSLTNLVELLEPPPCSTPRGPVGTRVVRMPSPQILS